jgi:RimJ/RimL family protein N-acetyltransferase
VFAYSLGEGAELRPLEPWRAEEFAAHVARVRDHLAPWVPFATRVVDAASARVLLQRYADKQARDEGAMYGIWQDQTLVGGTLFRDFDAQTGICEIGVWLAPEAEGRGLVIRAVRHMIDWAVVVRGITRVEWRTDPDNARSRAVAQRLGMTLDGVLRASFPINDELRDTEVWSLLASELKSEPAVLAGPAAVAGPALVVGLAESQPQRDLGHLGDSTGRIAGNDGA